MKKLIAVIIITCSAAFAVLEDPIPVVKEPVILVKDKITVNETDGSTRTENKIARCVDAKTVEIVTTVAVTPAETVQTFDRAVLQTELDHMPDRIAEIQKQMDEAISRRDELVKILGVFDK